MDGLPVGRNPPCVGDALWFKLRGNIARKDATVVVLLNGLGYNNAPGGNFGTDLAVPLPIRDLLLTARQIGDHARCARGHVE